MAVYTKLSEKELKEFFSKYNLGELLNYKEIKEGIENTNYFIQTEKGKFILTLYEKILSILFRIILYIRPFFLIIYILFF